MWKNVRIYLENQWVWLAYFSHFLLFHCLHCRIWTISIDTVVSLPIYDFKLLLCTLTFCVEIFTHRNKMSHFHIFGDGTKRAPNRTLHLDFISFLHIDGEIYLFLCSSIGVSVCVLRCTSLIEHFRSTAFAIISISNCETSLFWIEARNSYLLQIFLNSWYNLHGVKCVSGMPKHRTQQCM